MLFVFKLKPLSENAFLSSYFDFKDTKAIAITIKKAPILDNTVTGSFKTIIDKITATTTSDKRRTVEVEADRCLSPSSQK